MEYITVNDTQYECQKIVTSTNSISFTLVGQEIGAISETFKDVTELTVSNETAGVYGTYSYLTFQSATVYEDGSITVVMHIPSEEELRLAALETSQAEQDEIIAELIYGGM